MNKITESEIEKFAIELLEKQGYQYVYAPDIAPDSAQVSGLTRQSYEDVLLIERLQNTVGRINPRIPADVCKDAIKQILRLNSPELISNNEAFHRMLTEGIKVTYQRDGQARGDLVWLIDFKNPENNDFLVANQFTVIENNINKRPDVILFVNGIPIVVIELKNPADENATVRSAFKQIQTYLQAIHICRQSQTFLFIMVFWLFPMDWKLKQELYLPDSAVSRPGKHLTGRLKHHHLSGNLKLWLKVC